MPQPTLDEVATRMLAAKLGQLLLDLTIAEAKLALLEGQRIAAETERNGHLTPTA